MSFRFQKESRKEEEKREKEKELAIEKENYSTKQIVDSDCNIENAQNYEEIKNVLINNAEIINHVENKSESELIKHGQVFYRFDIRPT